MAERRLGTPDCMCGYCETGWDILMGRARPFDRDHHAAAWFLKCHFGGCDPECWEHVDEDGTIVSRPPFSTKYFHRRDSNVPWNMQVNRRVSKQELIDREVEEAKKRKADLALFDEDADADEMEWV